MTREVEIECLPGNIPAHLPLDVSELAIGDALRIASLPAARGRRRSWTIPRRCSSTSTHPTKEKEPEAAAAEAAAEPTEPEVLKKGKVVDRGRGGRGREAEKPEKAEKKEKKEK